MIENAKGSENTIGGPQSVSLVGSRPICKKPTSLAPGAQINMDTGVAPGGGKAVVISAADPAVRERAKATVQKWIQEPGPAGLAPLG